MSEDILAYQHASLLDLIRRRGYETMLDLGCGLAEKACFFAENANMRVTALDEFDGHGSEARVDSVRESIEARGLTGRIRLLRMDARDIAGLTEKYDVIFAQNSLHHIFPSDSSGFGRTVDFFETLSRKLEPGGALYICEVGRFNFWDRIAKIIPGPWYSDSSLFRTINRVHFHDKTPARQWRRVLRAAGYDLISLRYFVPYPFRHLKILLANRFFNPFLETSYMMAFQRN